LQGERKKTDEKATVLEQQAALLRTKPRAGEKNRLTQKERDRAVVKDTRGGFSEKRVIR